MKEKLEYYKNRARDLFEVSLLLDSNPLGDKDSNLIREFWDLSKSDKLLQVLHVIKKAVPEVFWDKMRVGLYDDLELPFSPEKFSFAGLLDRGGVAKVYLLESKVGSMPSYVFKVIKDSYFKLKGIPEEEGGKFLLDEYNLVRSWYSEKAQAVFLPEYVIRMKGPSERKGVFAILQPFQSGSIKDLFNEITKEELVDKFDSNEELKNLFLVFTKETLAHEKETGEVLDFLGNKNLSIIESEKEEQLVVLDPHVIYKTSDPEKNVGERSREKLRYLADLLHEIE